MGVGVDRLRHDEVREALRLLGEADPPSGRPAALRALRDKLRGHGLVPALLDGAPEGARAAFVRLAQDGPATVEALLERGWWGHGQLPRPLDWLQRRGLITIGDDDLVHATVEAVEGWGHLILDLGATAAVQPADPEAADTDPDAAAEDSEVVLRVEPAGAVVIAPTPAALSRALAAPGADLSEVAPTVAVSPKSPKVVVAALRSAGVRLHDDLTVAADAAAPALPGSVEEAANPRAVRALLERAVAEERQVWLRYFASSRGGTPTERTVDPWTFADDLLHGWCHLRDAERSFAVDRVGQAKLLGSHLDHRPER